MKEKVYKIKLFIKRWISTTNHKDIGILYLLFGFIVKIGTIFSILIRIELGYPGAQILNRDNLKSKNKKGNQNLLVHKMFKRNMWSTYKGLGQVSKNHRLSNTVKVLISSIQKFLLILIT